jgi:hypothetical protein
VKAYVLIMVFIMAVPCLGQAECDLNNDGIYNSISDFIFLINELSSPEIYFDICDNECDPDEDGLPLTIADITLLVNSMIDPNYPDSAPDFARNPDSDTIGIESILTSPGAQLSLPVYLSTIDTLTAFQFYISCDPEYLEIIGFENDLDLNLIIAYGFNNVHAYTFNGIGAIESISLMPGNYHVGDLLVNVDENIEDPVTTYVSFSGCPDHNFYTGLANLPFFEPILVNGEITIEPTGIEHEESVVLPDKISINVYPNPFNSDAILKVNSPVQDELIIYDMLGREIVSFQIQPGFNNICWHAADDNGMNVDSGIYFAKLRHSSGLSARKLLFLK